MVQRGRLHGDVLSADTTAVPARVLTAFCLLAFLAACRSADPPGIPSPHPGPNVTRVREIQSGGGFEPTVSVLEITEPEPCYEGDYEDWPAEDIADDIITLYQDHGFIVGEPTIHRLVDLYPADAEDLGFPPEAIYEFCVPDLAMVLEGEFHWRDAARDLREEPYLMIIVDRFGHIWYTAHTSDPQRLLDKLPTP